MLNADADKAEIIQNELNAITTQRLNGAKIRSRAQWIEEGEKPTSFFFNLEQSKQANACISKLSTINGDITSDKDILEAAKLFYQSLYKDEPVDEASQE